MSTIAAISTPIGVGGISVIRLSGKDAKNIASKVFCLSKIKDIDIEPRKMYLGEFKAENFNEKYFLHIQIASAEPANGSFFRMHDKKRDNQN